MYEKIMKKYLGIRDKISNEKQCNFGNKLTKRTFHYRNLLNTGKYGVCYTVKKVFFSKFIKKLGYDSNSFRHILKSYLDVHYTRKITINLFFLKVFVYFHILQKLHLKKNLNTVLTSYKTATQNLDNQR